MLEMSEDDEIAAHLFEQLPKLTNKVCNVWNMLDQDEDARIHVPWTCVACEKGTVAYPWAWYHVGRALSLASAPCFPAAAWLSVMI